MASFGAKYPCFAPFAGEEPANALPNYGAAVVLGRMISANLTVNLASGDLYSDDSMSEKVDEFASGTIALETDDILDDVASVIYGATVAEKKVTYGKEDAPPLGGLAYYKVLQRNGKRFYKGYFYPKTQAALGNDTAQTRGNSITFGTSSTTFTVMPAETGAWRITETFDTEAACRAWVQEQLAPPPANP